MRTGCVSEESTVTGEEAVSRAVRKLFQERIRKPERRSFIQYCRHLS